MQMEHPPSLMQCIYSVRDLGNIGLKLKNKMMKSITCPSAYQKGGWSPASSGHHTAFSRAPGNPQALCPQGLEIRSALDLTLRAREDFDLIRLEEAPPFSVNEDSQTDILGKFTSVLKGMHNTFTSLIQCKMLVWICVDVDGT